MRVYATGMNPADSNALKRNPRVALFQAVVPLMYSLRQKNQLEMWKATRVGDPLPTGTDAVFVSVMLPRSLNCPYALGAIWTMSEALRLDLPLVIYMTDWAFFKARSEFRSIAKAGVPYFSKRIGGEPQYNESVEMIAKHGDQLIDLCRQYDDPKSKLWQRAQVLVPKYTKWGNMKIIQEYLPGARTILPYDPTPVFYNYLKGGYYPGILFSPHLRAKEWFLPSLLKNDKWVDEQNLKWPIRRIGPKGHDTVDSEIDVQSLYRNYAGAICPPYPTAGSGWWRSRWIHSALAKSVLLCNNADGFATGAEYRFPAHMYERAQDSVLDEMANLQSEKMVSLLQLDYAVFEDQIQLAFEKART